MPQLLLIKAETARDGLQFINDVVGVYPDDHVFSDHEYTVFNVIAVSTGLSTVADVQSRFNQIAPTIVNAMQWLSDGKYHFDTEEPESGWYDEIENPAGEQVIDSIQVYQVEGGSRWYKCVNDFKFPLNVENLTPEEKQLIATIDINHPSVDSFIRKVAKDITQLDGNDIEIKELRNQTP